jgi:quinol monooxygenase YgiN
VIIVSGSFRLPLGVREAGREAMVSVIAASRAEPGCIAYAYAEDVNEPGLFRVTEAWAYREELTAHFGMPHRGRQTERVGRGLQESRRCLPSYG